jgi:hypothetical protein
VKFTVTEFVYRAHFQRCEDCNFVSVACKYRDAMASYFGRLHEARRLLTCPFNYVERNLRNVKKLSDNLEVTVVSQKAGRAIAQAISR